MEIFQSLLMQRTNTPTQKVKNFFRHVKSIVVGAGMIFTILLIEFAKKINKIASNIIESFIDEGRKRNDYIVSLWDANKTFYLNKNDSIKRATDEGLSVRMYFVDVDMSVNLIDSNGRTITYLSNGDKIYDKIYKGGMIVLISNLIIAAMFTMIIYLLGKYLIGKFTVKKQSNMNIINNATFEILKYITALSGSTFLLTNVGLLVVKIIIWVVLTILIMQILRKIVLKIKNIIWKTTKTTTT